MQKYIIGCLTYKGLDELTKSAIEDYKDPELFLYTIEGVRDELAARVNKELLNGTDIFVAGGANAEYIARATDAHVVKIKLNALDYLNAIFEALKIGGKIAVVYYAAEKPYIFESLEKHYSIKIGQIVYKETEELELKIKESNAEVIIGAGLSVEIAQRYGKKGVLIYPGEKAISDAITEAKDIAAAIRKENQQSNFIKAIIELSPNGIVLANEEDEIITFNPASEKIVGISAAKAKGNKSSKIVPECSLEEIIKNKLPLDKTIKEINENKVVVSSLPIDDGKRVIGALAILSPVSDYFHAEKKARDAYKEKGFRAKNTFNDIIGKSDALKSTIEKAKIFSKSNSNVLITGETGVGKEMFSQSVHNSSLRSSGPFVAINCSALPENLLESELFGYEEGAFTGTRKGGKVGLFELANGGTLLLDEIGELSINLQSRLLRVIQEKEVMRLGGDRMIPIDVRIISATNRNLEDALPNEFRKDLLYRLNVLQLHVPSLKERQNDVIEIFSKMLNKKFDFDDYSLDVSDEVLNILTFYSWPGNIRELQNVCERFYLYLSVSSGIKKIRYQDLLVKAIGEERLLSDILKSSGIKDEGEINKNCITKELMEKIENVFPYNKEVLAKKLGISRTTLWRIIKSE